MTAVEFIKKFGWEEAKHRTKPEMLDMWVAGWGFRTEELKRYVEAYEIVELVKGVNESLYSPAIKQAIQLVEEVESE